MTENRNSLKISHIKVSTNISAAWDAYKFVRDSPASLGGSKLRKAASLTVYLLVGAVALFFFRTVITHQTIFTNLIAHNDGGPYEAPSVIVCPEKSKVYEYTAYYMHEMISSLNLSVTEVNLLAQAANTRQLNSAATKEKLGKHSSESSPSELWDKIVTGVYKPLVYDWQFDGDQKDLIWNYGVDFDCKELKYSSDERGFKDQYGNLRGRDKFNCKRIQDIWLNDKSYCFLWNNTGIITLFNSALKADNIVVRLKPYSAQGMRLWMGSLFTDEIILAYYPSSDDDWNVNYQIYRSNELKYKRCQLLLETCDESFRPGPPLKYNWIFPVSVTINPVAAGQKGTGRLILREAHEWQEIHLFQRFTGLVTLEVLGNFLGFFIGISFLGFGRVLIIMLKSCLPNLKKSLLAAQFVGIILLLAGVIIVQWFDYDYFQTNRFQNQFDMKILDNGLPLGKNVQICPRFIAIYNKTAMEEYNISQPLFNYLGVVGRGSTPQNWIRGPHYRPEDYGLVQHFMFDKHATVDLSYHWHFMTLPMQDVSHEFYETHMNQVEKEYTDLANKMGISLESPGYEVQKRLFLEPCKLIKFCYVDQEIVHDCCNHFHYKVIERDQEFTGCLELKEDKMQFRQRKPGKANGLRVLFNVEELHKHGAPQVWYDAYLKAYMEKCKLAYNCGSSFPKWTWQPYDLWQLIINYETPITSRYGSQWRTGHKIEAVLELKHVSMIKRDDKCQSESYPFTGYRMLRQLLVKSVCGCHICYGEREIPYLNVPCCKPKWLGRCVTRAIWYTIPCENWTGGKHHPYQSRLIGNVSITSPYNYFLYGAHMCNFKLSLKKPNSKFYQIYKDIEKKGVLAEIRKPDCDSWIVDGNAIKILKPPASQNSSIFEEDKYFTFHLYYDMGLYTDYKEIDLLNFVEMISLFCGAIGLVLGLNLIVLIEIVFYLLWWLSSNWQSWTIPYLTESLNNYAGAHFLKRFAIKKVQKSANVAPEDRPGQEKCSHLDEPVDASKPSTSANLQLKDTKQYNKQERTVSSKKGPNRDHSHNTIEMENLEDTKKRAENAPVSSNAVSEASEPVEKKLGVKTKIALSGVVLAGILASVFSCLTLRDKMAESEMSVQFQISENFATVTPPSLGVCQSRKISGYGTFEKARRSLLSTVHKCSYRDDSVDCNQVFTVFLRTREFDCALANFSSMSQNHQNFAISDYEVYLNASSRSLNIWLGGIETIRDDNFDVSSTIEPGSEIKVKYQQWELVNMHICQQNMMHVCPGCRANTIRDEEYCCLTESIQPFNLTMNSREPCRYSLYRMRKTPAALSGFKAEIGKISVFPEVRAKRVIIRDIRRTSSEKFMLYAGLLDIFIGLNLTNILFIAIGIILGCLFRANPAQ